MGVVAALAVGAVVAAGASAYSANQTGKAGKKAANASQAAAERNYDINQQYLDYVKKANKSYQRTANNIINDSASRVGQAYGEIDSIIGNIPNLGSYLNSVNRPVAGNVGTLQDYSQQAEDLSQRDFNFRTERQRENLDFVLGSSAQDLRDAQNLNAGLASLDESTFTSGFQKILQSSMLGLKASTIGEPTGTFANLSARNLYNFSQQGLSNYLAINDFYSREGTVDPISPYEISSDLYNQAFARTQFNYSVDSDNYQRQTQNLLAQYNAEVSIAGLNINNRQGLLQSELGINDSRLNLAGQAYQNAQGIASLGMGISNNYNNSIAEAQGARAAAQAAEASGYAQATSTLVSGLTGAYSAGMQQTALNNQTNYTNAMISQMNAPRASAPTASYSAIPAYQSYQPTAQAAYYSPTAGSYSTSPTADYYGTSGAYNPNYSPTARSAWGY